MFISCVSMCLSRLKTKLRIPHVRCLFYRKRQINYKVQDYLIEPDELRDFFLLICMLD